MTAARATDQHTPLGTTGWMLWSDAALRGAGFPAERFLELCDDELAAAADQLAPGVRATRKQYAKVFAAAVDRLTAVMRRIAGESAFREAVTWQNPTLVSKCLDRAVEARPRDFRSRADELTITSYLQRYCLKNDTIGFFGPVGWARLGPQDTGVSVTPGPGLLSNRATYFENWAIDAVADVIASRPEVWQWLRPQATRAASLTGRILRLPFRRPVTLSAAEVRVLRLCDGTCTVRDIAGDPPDPEVVAVLVRLGELGAVRNDLTGALSVLPEQALAERIDAITDPAVRARARMPLDELVGARDDVATAAGDPDRLLSASRALAETFERITGIASTRRPGRAYAGRTLVYEDAVRDTDVHIGRRVIDRLAPPLGLLLDSATWLANTVGERYEERARQLLDLELARTGGDAVPLLQLLTSVMPEFGANTAGVKSVIVDEVRDEFQRRWRRVLGTSPDTFDRVPRYQVAASTIAEDVAREFATGPALWGGAGWHSPDVMLAADDAATFADGDLDFVLGELHCGCNTLESQFFATQHPEPGRLRAAAVASHLDRRMIIIPTMDSPQATSRMCRAAELRLPSYTYLRLGRECFEPPPGAVALPVLTLTARRNGDALVVHHRESGAEYSFLEVVGEPLSALVADAFRPFDGGRHRPRVTIDRLVVSREAWTFPAAKAAWAFDKNEQQRYAQARRWRAKHGLPERGFVSVPVERKPTAVDFRSLPLVNLLAKSIRRTAEAGPGVVTIVEMLPDLDRLWLRDARGDRYTAELRMIAVRGG